VKPDEEKNFITLTNLEEMEQSGLVTLETPISFEKRPKSAEEEMEWDLDDLIGPEPKLEEDKWKEALLKIRKPGGKGLSTCAQLAEELDGKLYDKLKKIKECEKPRLRRQISEDFARKHEVTLQI
jgi:hypothetical protein